MEFLSLSESRKGLFLPPPQFELFVPFEPLPQALTQCHLFRELNTSLSGSQTDFDICRGGSIIPSFNAKMACGGRCYCTQFSSVHSPPPSLLYSSVVRQHPTVTPMSVFTSAAYTYVLHRGFHRLWSYHILSSCLALSPRSTDDS
jgi:hypothetical protein